MANDRDQSAGRDELRYRLVASDVVALVATFGSAAIVHGGGPTGPKIAVVAITVICTLAGLQGAGLYRSPGSSMRSVEAVGVLGACAVGASAFALGQWLARSASPGAAAAGGAVAAAAILALRWRFEQWLKGQRLGGRYLRPVLLVGTNEDADALYTMLNDEPELGYRIVAVVGPPRSGVPWAQLEACVETDKLGVLAARTGARGVMVVASALSPGERAQAIRQALACGLHLQLWAGVSGIVGRRTRMTQVGGVPMCGIEPQCAVAWQLGVKRLMDLVIASATSILVAPLLLLAALVIRLEDGGSAIYRHRVVGRFGEPITVLKLRSMVQDASSMMPGVVPLNERVGGPLFKASDDPRVTRIGRLLRATSIDELPQLWNVLNGTMSMVGPRFALPSEVEQFDEDLRRRHQMRPGITGLWQSEARDNPSFSAYRRLDLLYIDNWSLRLDLAILVNTVYAVCSRALRELRSLIGHGRADVVLPVSDTRPVGDTALSLGGSAAAGPIPGPAGLARPGYQASPAPLLGVATKARPS